MTAVIDRKLIHHRQVVCLGYERSDGLWDIEGTVTDRKPFPIWIEERGTVVTDEPIHEMTLRIAVDRTLQIHEVEVRVNRSPYRVCPAISHAYQQLVGLRIGSGFSLKIKRLFQGVEGCTHLTELLGPMATTAFQALWDKLIDVDQPSSGKTGARFALNGCHALRADGELVRLYFSDSVDVQR
ncbi:DUF2889 domain-containing protein [Pseudomonas gingeri]|uniref:DUF2889 domain-containing protein n=1 Tax=Pseudomonas gingeri TaxID=117681 RepID=UPI00159FE21E|nr:DUF2889 domain-containing protein [Pseudomonas gingeri]NWD66929.1 DUF2889 domain-containing protein [Pseudomonas gingeri]